MEPSENGQQDAGKQRPYYGTGLGCNSNIFA